MAITTAFCTSAKAELLAGAHCCLAPVTPTASTTANAATLTNVTSTAGIAVGMAVSGAGINPGSVVASIDSASQITISQPAIASADGVSLTLVGDVFRIALFKQSPNGSYGASTNNYADMTGSNDETSGVGYVASGLPLSNVSPAISGTTAFISFAPNPSWTNASFATDGCMIYNSSARLGGMSGTNSSGAGRTLGVFSFGGTQQSDGGTLTILFPAATSSSAIFRLTG